MTISVRIVRLSHAQDLPLPSYGSVQAAGVDLCAALPAGEMVVAPGAVVAVPTGLQIALPDDYEAQIRPRSGLALKAQVTVANAPGTIDADYRGEIKVLLINMGHENFHIQHGDRIAQMIIAPVCRIAWQEDTVLDETQRGSGGFGSTGVRFEAV